MQHLGVGHRQQAAARAHRERDRRQTPDALRLALSHLMNSAGPATAIRRTAS